MPAPLRRSATSPFQWASAAFVVAGFGLLLADRFLPHARTATMALFVVLPWCLLAVLHRAHGEITVGAGRRDPRARAEYALFLPLCFGFFVALTDWPLVHGAEIVPAWIAGSLLTLAAFVAVVRRVQRCGSGAYASLGFFAALYGGLLGLFVNCGLDRSEGSRFPVRVLERHVVSGGRHGPNYYVHVAPFPGYASGRTVQVGRRFYNAHPAGSAAELTLHPGTLRAAWYELR